MTDEPEFDQFQLGGECGPFVAPAPITEEVSFYIEVERLAKEYPTLDDRMPYYNFLHFMGVSKELLLELDEAVLLHQLGIKKTVMHFELKD